MKKYILFTFLSIFVFMSCSNKEDKKFSCDPNIDNWVKSNVSTIRYMKRTEWLKLDEFLKNLCIVHLHLRKGYVISGWIN